MNSVHTEYTPLLRERFERKFLISPFSRSQAELIIRLHPAVFSPLYKQRQVNNLYLDTARLSCFHDNIQGNSHRKKYRIRWYGDLFGDVCHPVLEMKMKDGFAGRKLSFPLDTFILDNEFHSGMLKNILCQENLPSWVTNEINDLRPSLLNSYQRKYFLSYDKNFRITVDDHLAYYYVFSWENKFVRKRTISTEVVMELKYNAEHDDWAEQITGRFPFRMTKNSKYINGILLLNPQVTV